MDIQPIDLVFIKRALLNNSAVLFTGAGFSRDAVNVLDRKIPTSAAFSDQIWEYLGYSGSRTRETLPQLFEAALSKGHEPLKGLLKNNFECKNYASWYREVSQFFWYRIYTTNIDNVLERVYHDSNKTRLKRVDGQKDDFSDRDQFLNEIQYVKLNGVDWTSPKDVTFSFRQYARRSGEAPVWYEQLARDFVTRVVIFIGTELDETLFWSAIEMRGKKYGDGEKRLKSFWIKPTFSPVDLDNLGAFNVVGISGTAKDFFELLRIETDKERQLEEVLKATHPNFCKLAHSVIGTLNNKQFRDLEQFYGAFSPVIIPDRVPSTRKSFLLGAAPDWVALYNNLDASRTCTGDLSKLVEDEFASKELSIVSVAGYAGCGKTTILKRLALYLRARGYLVFWSNGETYVPAHVFQNAISVLPTRPVLFFDNVSQMKGALVNYLTAYRSSSAPPIFIIADRTNKLVHFELSLAVDFKVVKFGVPNLSPTDIEALLATLESNGLLGKLQGMPRARQIYEFSIRAGKQLLVAMREATSGVEFDQIIGSEFTSLSSDEIRIIYLAVCIATSSGYSVSPQQFVALSDLEPNQALSVLDGELRDIVIGLGVNGSSRSALIARHRIIASLIVDQLTPRELLQQAYIRLLAVLSKDVAYPIKASSRNFRLYKSVISHQAIWQRFPHALEQARSIFESVREHFRNDSHFWLQYGSLELEYGELELADVYISSSESLAPHDHQVQNTKGFLLYKRSIASNRVMEAISLREAARKVLEAQSSRSPDDSYAPHILHSMELEYIKIWVINSEDRKRSMTALRREIDLCVKNHQYSDRLSHLKRTIHDAYLEMALID